jgi:hypothetical protein
LGAASSSSEPSSRGAPITSVVSVIAMLLPKPSFAPVLPALRYASWPSPRVTINEYVDDGYSARDTTISNAVSPSASAPERHGLPLSTSSPSIVATASSGAVTVMSTVDAVSGTLARYASVAGVNRGARVPGETARSTSAGVHASSPPPR